MMMISGLMSSTIRCIAIARHSVENWEPCTLLERSMEI